jgi:hypothetical protein
VLETSPSSTSALDPSIPTPRAGRPYADLEEMAKRLSARLRYRALGCSTAERKRLELLSAVAARIQAALSNTGAKL